MEVLTAYVRQNAPNKNRFSALVGRWYAPAGTIKDAPEVSEDKDQAFPADIQAVMTVIGRRNLKYDPPDSELDLSGTDLSRLHLGNAHFERANFVRTNLTETSFENAYLSEANFSFANLKDTIFSGANLHSANIVRAYCGSAHFSKANLDSAILTKSEFPDVDFDSAILAGARLYGAYLSSAHDLTQNQLIDTHGDAGTRIPSNLVKPILWSK